MTIKAIETRYKGCRFRSRLEARWAVFLDAAGVPWEYEPEGFDLGAAGLYLPDFRLPRERVWLEIKPGEPSEDEQAKCGELAIQSNESVVMICGSPRTEHTDWGGEVAAFSVSAFHGWHPPNARLFTLGPYIFKYCFGANSTLYEFLREKGYDPSPPPATTRDAIISYVELDRDYWRKTYGGEHPQWRNGLREKEVSLFIRDGAIFFDCQGQGRQWSVCPVVSLALAAARDARFEHGQQPVIDEITLAADEWLANAGEILAARPVRRVRLKTMPEVGVWGSGKMTYWYALGAVCPDETHGLWLCRGADPRETALALLRTEWPGIEFTIPE